MDFAEKVAIVTGSSRGIGAAIATRLAGQGAKVAVDYVRNRDRGEQVVTAIEEAGGTAILVQADVTDQNQVAELVRRAEAELGPIDILVNNANMRFPIKPFLEYSWAEFESKLLDEMHAAFYCCQAVAPGMVERGSGCIVNVSSGLSRAPGPGFVAHTSAKSALDGFSKALAFELGPAGVRVNVVAPGLTVTDATAHQSPDRQKAVAARTPLRRLGQPDDIAGAVVFLCSDAARFVTGAYLPVSGGSLML